MYKYGEEDTELLLRLNNVVEKYKTSEETNGEVSMDLQDLEQILVEMGTSPTKRQVVLGLKIKYSLDVRHKLFCCFGVDNIIFLT